MAKADSVTEVILDFFSTGSWKIRLAVILERVLFLALAVFVLSDIFLLLQRRSMPAAEEQGPPKNKDFTVNKIVPLSFYQDAVNKRKLFGGHTVKEVKIAGNEDASISQIASNLNLSGIIAGDTPKAIIEEKKEHKSYFLKEGESIGDVKLNKISDGKVIMEYKGTGFELVL